MYTKKIYFSGGDFHELQEVFRDLPGVVSTRTGYINAEGTADFAGVASGEAKAY
ncbi:MAG: peptide-methionine (S)-S-oxide reductase, partial [Selenomonadaceae bacterium]|nr:peptide-methionine (S)-S-oxide reductase [Selenomonadaceae bacterium]